MALHVERENGPLVLLLLVSGLPGSGKSTFLQSLSSYLTESEGHTLRVFHLDDFMVGTSDASRSSFSAERWHQAEEQLFCEVSSCLSAAREEAVAASGSPSANLLRIVAVEDNFHYLSMRRRYWKLCCEWDGGSTCELKGTSVISPIRMLEVHIRATLSEAQQRNAVRPAVSRIPCSVINAMHHRFDYCIPEENERPPETDWGWCCPFSTGSANSEWPVVWYAGRDSGEGQTAVAALWHAIHQTEEGRDRIQHHQRLLREKKIRERRQREQEAEDASSCSHNPVHQLDQQLRRLVSLFWKEVESGEHVAHCPQCDRANLSRRIGRLKQEALAAGRRRRLLDGSLEHGSLEHIVRGFEAALRDLRSHQMEVEEC